MNDGKTIKKIDSLRTTTYFYLFSVAGIFISHAIFPTNLAGPGLDIIFYLIFILGTCFFLFRSIFNLIKHGRVFLRNVMINGVVLLINIGLLFISLL